MPNEEQWTPREMRTRARKRIFDDSLVAEAASRGLMVEIGIRGKGAVRSGSVGQRRDKDDEDLIG